MVGRIYLWFGILVLLGTLCSSPVAQAQSQGCAESALSPHEFAQKTRIKIASVELAFEGDSPLSEAVFARLTEEVRDLELWVTPEEPDSSWVNQALNPMREAIRSQGYFKADLEAVPYLILAQANERRYVLRVLIESGPQFRLGNLQFASVSDKPLQFSEALLRQQIHLQKSDLFNVTKIRDGLVAIGKLYGSKGYIDATPEPDTTIDEKSSRIDLLINVDEQKPYRVAKIELLGLGMKTQNEPSAPQEIGDFFNPVLWQNFFRDASFVPRFI
jgi:outer membrane protein assembly factor BamA